MLRGVVAPCYQHHNEVPQLHATLSELLDYYMIKMALIHLRMLPICVQLATETALVIPYIPFRYLFIVYPPSLHMDTMDRDKRKKLLLTRSIEQAIKSRYE